MTIVSNASPLIYLAKVGKLNLLQIVFKEVVIPEEVKEEVVDKGKELGEKEAYMVEKAIAEGWLKVSRAEILETPIELNPGELATISLAKKLNTEVLDETPGRVAAKLFDLTPRGTIFVLLKSLKMGNIDLNQFIETLNQMIKHGFRLKEEVYMEAMREAIRLASK